MNQRSAACIAHVAHPATRSIWRAIVFGLLISVSSESVADVNELRTDKRDRVVQVQMHGVLYHFTKEIAVRIDVLQGELVPSRSSPIPVFDDKNSFTLRIDDARIVITASSLAAVLNSHVFAATTSPLKDISLHVEKDELKIKGKLHSKGDIPFEMSGAVSATRAGKIRIHAKSIRAFHLPVKGLMDLFGIQIARVIKAGKVPGLEAEKDDLLLDPQTLLPPPRIQGHVTDVRLQGDGIVQFFGTPAKVVLSQPGQNYMQYTGKRLRFGKLTMNDTDLVLLDMDPTDPFDFYLDHYKEQLVAGYTKTTPSFGLRVYMRDFNKVRRPSTAAGQM